MRWHRSQPCSQSWRRASNSPPPPPRARRPPRCRRPSALCSAQICNYPSAHVHLHMSVCTFPSAESRRFCICGARLVAQQPPPAEHHTKREVAALARCGPSLLSLSQRTNDLCSCVGHEPLISSRSPAFRARDHLVFGGQGAGKCHSAVEQPCTAMVACSQRRLSLYWSEREAEGSRGIWEGRESEREVMQEGEGEDGCPAIPSSVWIEVWRR